MPIRPENVARYPSNWREISAQVRALAGNCCECRGECGSVHDGPGGRCDAPNGKLIERDRERPEKWRIHEHTGTCMGEDCEAVLVVLTVAHLDHQPENCERTNLRAMCQRCHNRYDREHRSAGIRQRRHEARASADLFATVDNAGGESRQSNEQGK